MRNRRLVEYTLALVLFIALIVGPVGASHAAPVTLTLARTTAVTTVTDSAGFTLYDGGTVTLATNIIGRYVRAIRTFNGSELQNTGIVTITLLGLGAAPPQNVTLFGSHDLTSGSEIGGVGASSVVGLATTWSLTTVSAGVYTLTLGPS